MADSSIVLSAPYCERIEPAEYEKHVSFHTARETRKLIEKVYKNPELASRCKYFSPSAPQSFGGKVEGSAGLFPWRAGVNIFLVFSLICLALVSLRAIHVMYFANMTTAAKFGQTHRVLELVSSYKCDNTHRNSSNCLFEVDELGNTPLHAAARSGSEETVLALLPLMRADVMAQNIVGDTPLHLASSEGITTVLLSSVSKEEIESSILHRNALGFTPLSLATSPKQVQILVDAIKIVKGDYNSSLIHDFEVQIGHLGPALPVAEAASRMQICRIIWESIDTNLVPQRILKRLVSISADPFYSSFVGDLASRLPMRSLHSLVSELLSIDSTKALKYVSTADMFEAAFCHVDGLGRSLWSKIGSLRSFEIARRAILKNCIQEHDIKYLWSSLPTRTSPSDAVSILSQITPMADPESKNGTSLDFQRLLKIMDQTIVLSRKLRLSRGGGGREISLTLPPGDSVLLSCSSGRSDVYTRLQIISDTSNIRGYELISGDSGLVRGPQKANNWFGWYPSWTSSSSMQQESKMDIVLSCANMAAHCSFVASLQAASEPEADEPYWHAWFRFGSNMFAHARLATLVWIPLSVRLPSSVRFLPFGASILGLYSAGPSFFFYWISYTGVSISAMFAFQVIRRLL